MIKNILIILILFITLFIIIGVSISSRSKTVDCVVSDFGEFSECSAPCGGGTQTRTRSIVSPPSDGGLACPSLSETRDCNTQACDIIYKFTTSSIIKADRTILDIIENWADYKMMGTILEDAQIKSIIIKSPTVRDQGFGDFKSTYGVFIERKDSTPDGLPQLISLIPETNLPHYPRPSSGQSSNYTTLDSKVIFVPPINVKTGDELWVYVLALNTGYLSEINTCEIILQTFY